MDTSSAAAIFSALGQPRRIEILRLLVPLGHDGMKISEIRQHLGIAATTLGFHLDALERAGVVRTRREGRSVFVSPNFASIDEVVAFLLSHCCAGRRTEPPAAARCCPPPGTPDG